MSDRWDQHFLRMAYECARMSKDPNTQVGAIIVGPDREVLSSGFNGLPRGIADASWRLENRDLKLKLIVHAEMNAILNAARCGIALKGSSLYLLATDGTGLRWGGPPCVRCTVEIIQTGITNIASLPFKSGQSNWSSDMDISRSLLKEAGVDYREIESM